jgi:hypothetical protein
MLEEVSSTVTVERRSGASNEICRFLRRVAQTIACIWMSRRRAVSCFPFSSRNRVNLHLLQLLSELHGQQWCNAAALFTANIIRIALWISLSIRFATRGGSLASSRKSFPVVTKCIFLSSKPKARAIIARNANQLYHSLLVPRRMMRNGRRTGGSGLERGGAGWSGGGRRPYCAKDRLIVAFRNATRSMPRLVRFLSYRRAFRTLRRLASPMVMAVATQKIMFAVSPISESRPFRQR